MKRVLIKIGGSVITKRGRPFTLDRKGLSRISSEIAGIWRKGRTRLCIVHGAGSFGHMIVKKTGIHKGITMKRQLMDFAVTQRYQNQLNVMVCEALNEAGVPAIPMQPSSFAVMKNGRLSYFPDEAVRRAYRLGMVPVLYGVPAYDSAMGCSILSGDELIRQLAASLLPSLIVHATDVDGIFDKDPKGCKGAKLIERVTRKNWPLVRRMLGGSGHVDVTGGMLKKISEVMRASPTRTVIVNAKKRGRLSKALSGEKVICTAIG